MPFSSALDVMKWRRSGETLTVPSFSRFTLLVFQKAEEWRRPFRRVSVESGLIKEKTILYYNLFH